MIWQPFPGHLWVGTNADLEAIIQWAERIAERAQDRWEGHLDAWGIPAPEPRLGDWACEVTSVFRGEPAIWRLGQIEEIVHNREGTKYLLRTLWDVEIWWQNCKMILVEDLE